MKKEKEINPYEGDMGEEIQSILTGHNEAISKVEELLTKPLMKLVEESKKAEGEELAGIMNFYHIEIVNLIRKAGAIGYYEAKNSPSSGRFEINNL